MLSRIRVVRPALRLLVAWSLVLLYGCGGSYITPGGAVSIPVITDTEIAVALAEEPGAQFPAQLIVTRVQASGYSSYTNQGYGVGAFSVLTNRDIETDADFDRIAQLPGVAAVGTLSRVLLPSSLTSATDLRTAAAQLRGDIMLMYTLDTSFRIDTTRLGPLSAIGLGFLPNKNAVVSSTCAVAFIDVRTGYVYGVAEATATEEQRSNYWNTTNAIDSARLLSERAAFSDALGEAEQLWRDIYAQYSDSS
jgi:hypothetical protein